MLLHLIHGHAGQDAGVDGRRRHLGQDVGLGAAGGHGDRGRGLHEGSRLGDGRQDGRQDGSYRFQGFADQACREREAVEDQVQDVPELRGHAGFVGVLFDVRDGLREDAHARMLRRRRGVAALGLDGELVVRVTLFRDADDCKVLLDDTGDAQPRDAAALVDDALEVDATGFQGLRQQFRRGFLRADHFFIVAEEDHDGPVRGVAVFEQGLDGFQHRDHVGLHVDRAAAPEAAVRNVSAEGWMGPVPHCFLRHRHHVLVADERNGVEARVRPLPGVEESGFADDFLLQGLMHQRVRLFEDLVEFVELRPVGLRLIEVGHRSN